MDERSYDGIPARVLSPKWVFSDGAVTVDGYLSAEYVRSETRFSGKHQVRQLPEFRHI